MSSPWAKLEKPEPVNLADIMSEEFARDLQAKGKKYPDNIANDDKNIEFDAETDLKNIPNEVPKTISSDDIKNDAVIAQLLQMQFDKEYDELKRTKEKFNGAPKVSISFVNYRRTSLNDDFESDTEEEIIDIQDKKDWDGFDLLKREIAAIPHCGYKKQNNGKLVTKHDVIVSGRKNACKLLSVPSEFQTGDRDNFDLKLPNKVLDSLKMHSKHEQTRRYKFYDKEENQATAEFGLDQYTRILLYKMINRQLLGRVNGVISNGKEAVILHADSDLSFPHAIEELPKECVLKVFKTTLSEFKQHDEYIKDDYRFRSRIGKQTSRKQIIQLWAEKEMANLMRLRKAGVPCPQAVTLRKHILVMSFIGENHKPAQKLKEAAMQDVDYIIAYKQVTEAMRAMYQKANLIHVELSEDNILWHNKQCYIIGVSQSIEPTHKNAFNYLFRDCYTITNFFVCKRVPEVVTPNVLFKSITGCYFSNKMALSILQEAVKMNHLVDRPGIEVITHNFDTMWKKAKTREILPVEVKKIISKVNLNLIEPPVA